MFPVTQQACKSQLAVLGLFSEKQSLNRTAFRPNKTAFKLNLNNSGRCRVPG